VIECKTCAIEKGCEDFYTSKTAKSGFRQPCRSCIKEQGKVKRKEYSMSEKEYLLPTKICGSCLVEKPVNDFRKRSDTPTGLGSDCKDCLKLKRHNHYVDNKEHTLQRTAEYRKNNLDKYRGYSAKYREENYDRYLERCRELRDLNRDYLNAQSRERNKIPKVKARLKIAHQKYMSNPEKAKRKKETSRVWSAINKDKICYYASQRRFMKKQATPIWADEGIILDFYKEAQHHGMEVDHIIPLKHPLVCGLHVEWNLQLLTRSDNAKKHNYFEITTHDVPPILEFSYE